MTEIIITIIEGLIPAISAVLCAVIVHKSNNADKARKAEHEEDEKRAALRLKEANLQLQMLHANSQLTVGVAMALKRGHCNGEVEAGLEAVQKADQAYSNFLAETAMTSLR